MPNVWLCRGLVSRSRAESPPTPLAAPSLSLTTSIGTRPDCPHHKPTLTRNTAREHRMASNVAAAKQRPAALKSNRRCPQRVQRNGTAPSFLCLAEAEARAVPAAASSGDDTPGGVTVEYQRKVAKELIQYFKEKEYEKQVLENQAFGWVKKAEISNGRWVMFGLLVGMMTEYATGKSFTDQVAITLTYMGFANFDV